MAITVPTELRIRRAALRLLEKKGPQAVTMRRLARSIGITPMAIYHHFETREVLLREVVEAEFDDFLDLLSKMLSYGAAEDQVVHALDTYMDYALSRPQIFDYIFSMPREETRRYPDDFRARRSPSLNPLADTVAKWMDDGVIEADDIWEVTLELWAHVHGYVVLHRAGRFNLTTEDFKELVHRSMRRLLYGLKSRKAPPSTHASSGRSHRGNAPEFSVAKRRK
ncbi:MAG: TetR/AcrR family transcriptional regulator [Steroidobacteraceae bacterium]